MCDKKQIQVKALKIDKELSCRGSWSLPGQCKHSAARENLAKAVETVCKRASQSRRDPFYEQAVSKYAPCERPSVRRRSKVAAAGGGSPTTAF